MKELIIKGNRMIAILRTDGIIELVNNEEWNQPDTLEVVKEDTSELKKNINEKYKGLLILVTSRYVNKEILRHYQHSDFGEIARALVLTSFATKVIGNLYFKLSKGKPNETGRVVPVKLFTDRDVATKWLLEQIKEHKKLIKV